MPERNILRIRQTYDYDNTGNYYYYYYTPIHQETARAFNLDRNGNDYINGTINSIRNKEGNIVHVINKPYNFEVFYYNSQFGNYFYAIKLPEEFIKDYGIREKEYIDIIFNSINQGKTNKIIAIFPKVLKIGELGITPKGIKHEEIANKDILIDYKGNDEYYVDLILEINYANAYGLYRSTMVLTRVLIENLLIDILRLHYGMNNVDIFYNKSKGYHNDLSILLGNMRNKIGDFKPLSRSFDEYFLGEIDKLRTNANATAHTLELNIEQEKVTKNKEQIRNICKLLFAMRDKLILDKRNHNSP